MHFIIDLEVFIGVNHIHTDFILEAIKESSENIVQWWLEAIQKEGSRCKKGKYKLRTYTCFKERFNSNCYVYCIMPGIWH